MYTFQASVIEWQKRTLLQPLTTPQKAVQHLSITALPCLGCEDESQEFSKLVQGHLLCRIIRIHPVNNHDI